MYSNKIDELIKLRNYILSNYEYLKITDVETSTQITNVSYKHENSGYDFQIKTNDGYFWKIKVIKKEN